MVFYVIGFPVGHFDAERAERLFLHSLLKLIRGEHIGLLVRPFVLLVKFLSEPIQRSITQRWRLFLYQPFHQIVMAGSPLPSVRPVLSGVQLPDDPVTNGG